MKLTFRTVLPWTLLLLPFAASAAEPFRVQLPFQIPHPAVGSWFGKADQVCASPATCQNVVLFMTPTIDQDNNFVANDSLSLGGPPFGPHTTAHGRWIPTDNHSIIADYVFMLPGNAANNLTVLRFRWNATVVDYNTMQGYVNIFFGPPVPVVYDNLTANQFPEIPAEATPALTAPLNFYKDATTCTAAPPACPLVFKFTVKRVQP